MRWDTTLSLNLCKIRPKWGHRVWGYAVGGWRQVIEDCEFRISDWKGIEHRAKPLEVGGALRLRLEAEDRGRGRFIRELEN